MAMPTNLSDRGLDPQNTHEKHSDIEYSAVTVDDIGLLCSVPKKSAFTHIGY